MNGSINDPLEETKRSPGSHRVREPGRDRGVAEPAGVSPGQTAAQFRAARTRMNLNPSLHLGSVPHGESRPYSKPHSFPGKQRSQTDSSPHLPASQWSDPRGLVVSMNIMSAPISSSKSDGKALIS